MSHCLAIELGLGPDRRGAGRDTRGRVCSPIPTACPRPNSKAETGRATDADPTSTFGLSKTQPSRSKLHSISGWLILASVLFCGVWAPSGRAAAPAATNTVLLFSFFRGNGEDGLYLASSADGLTWTELKSAGKSFLAPTVGGKLMRDPSLALGPDGTFRMVWTTGWGNPPVIGYAHSRDLVEWSEQRAIPVMAHEPTTRNAWAPELFFDATRNHWLIFWASTIPGRFPETEKAGDTGYNHRIYVTTTPDFQSFSPTRLFYNDGFNVIDATLLDVRGQYHLIVKDETRNPVKKHLRIAVSERPEGPYGPAGAPLTIDWVEGPSAVQFGDDYFIYFDHYAKPQYYGAVKSADLKQWRDISDQVHFPRGARHGTILKVPDTLIRRIDPMAAVR